MNFKKLLILLLNLNIYIYIYILFISANTKFFSPKLLFLLKKQKHHMVVTTITKKKSKIKVQFLYVIETLKSHIYDKIMFKI